MAAFKKVVRVGTGKDGDIFAKIEWTGDRLSISGVEGPKSNGDARGSAGQITMSYKEYDARGHKTLGEIQPAPGWSAETVKKFFDTWDRWHANDMRAGCEHQTKEGWAEKPIDPSKPTTAYGKHFPGQKQDSWNMLAWVSQSEHPDGLLSKPCPVCGYKYGSAWLKEAVPDEVIEFLAGLPDTDKKPAWV